VAKRKPWRKFKEKRLGNQHIRRVCLAVLAAEIVILKGQGRLHCPVIKVTENREVVIYQNPVEDGALEVLPKDQVYGIRIRLKEGMVDFYRREELHDGGQ